MERHFRVRLAEMAVFAGAGETKTVGRRRLQVFHHQHIWGTARGIFCVETPLLDKVRKNSTVERSGLSETMLNAKTRRCWTC